MTENNDPASELPSASDAKKKALEAAIPGAANVIKTINEFIAKGETSYTISGQIPGGVKELLRNKGYEVLDVTTQTTITWQNAK